MARHIALSSGTDTAHPQDLWVADGEAGTFELTGNSGAPASDNCSDLMVPPDSVPSDSAPSDLGRDTTGDILWRNDNSQALLWQVNGSFVSGEQGVSIANIEWHTAGTSEFDGDGSSDILWRNDNDQRVIWEMNGSSIAAQQDVANIAINWQIVAQPASRTLWHEHPAVNARPQPDSAAAATSNGESLVAAHSSADTLFKQAVILWGGPGDLAPIGGHDWETTLPMLQHPGVKPPPR
jgi:hypothetical protein